MRFEIFVCVRARIAELQRRRNDAAVLLVVALVVQHAERSGRHAVDAPLGVPVLVAYRDGEPAIVRPYQVDQFSLAAFDLQRLALASVCGVVPLYISCDDGAAVG